MRTSASEQGSNRWGLTANQARFYERVKVPRLFRPMAVQFLRHVQLAPGQRVVDVACGTGIVARLAASQVAPGGSVAGVDLNRSMLAVARAKAGGSPAIEWRQADAAELPYPDASFDVVLCQQGFQFFSDRVAALRDMRRVLVPGGIVSLCVFGAPSAYNAGLAEALARHADGQVAKRSLAPFALADAAVLRAIVEEAGFRDIETRADILMRRVEPTQEWLLQDSAGLPYAAVLADMPPETRAILVREIAAGLADFWDRDAYVVPTPSHVVLARK